MGRCWSLGWAETCRQDERERGWRLRGQQHAEQSKGAFAWGGSVEYIRTQRGGSRSIGLVLASRLPGGSPPQPSRHMCLVAPVLLLQSSAAEESGSGPGCVHGMPCNCARARTGVDEGRRRVAARNHVSSWFGMRVAGGREEGTRASGCLVAA